MAQGWPDYPAQGATNGDPSWGARPANAPLSPAPPPPANVGKRLRLETGPQIRRELVKIYRGMKIGEIDVTRGTKLIYALEVLSRAVERENVEKLAARLDAVEGQ